MRRWALDQLTRDPKIAQAVHEFERKERRAIRLGPVPTLPLCRSFAVMLEVDREPVLTLRFQSAPPVLRPGDLFFSALRHREEFARETVAYVALTIFLECAQDWPKREWAQVVNQLGMTDRALSEGFTFSVNGMRN